MRGAQKIHNPLNTPSTTDLVRAVGVGAQPWRCTTIGLDVKAMSPTIVGVHYGWMQTAPFPWLTEEGIYK